MKYCFEDITEYQSKNVEELSKYSKEILVYWIVTNLNSHIYAKIIPFLEIDRLTLILGKVWKEITKVHDEIDNISNMLEDEEIDFIQLYNQRNQLNDKLLKLHSRYDFYTTKRNELSKKIKYEE